MKYRVIKPFRCALDRNIYPEGSYYETADKKRVQKLHELMHIEVLSEEKTPTAPKRTTRKRTVRTKKSEGETS